MREAISISLLFAVVAGTGCSTDAGSRTSSQGVEDPGASSESLRPGRYAVAPSSADFYSGTGAAAERWTYGAGELWAFEVVSVDSGWVELRAPEPSELERHCYGVPDGLRGVGLRFYVERDDLLEVTTRPVDAEFDDGTAVELRPGVAVSGAEGESTARLHGLEPPVSVGDDRTGLAYRPADSPPRPEAGWWRPRGEVSVGGESFDPTETPLPVRREETRGGRTLLEIADGCGTVRAFADSPAEAEPPDRSRPEPDEAYRVSRIRPDAALYWLDGSTAGRSGESGWPVRVEVESRNGRPCFAAGFRTVAPNSYESGRHFRICVDESDLETPDEVARKRSGARGDRGDSGAVSVLETSAEIRLDGLTGEHSWDQVKRPIASRKDQLKNCYSEVVAPDRTIGGRVRLAVTIAGDGSVEEVRAEETTLGDSEVTSCLRDAFGEASFPSAAGASELEVELVFSVDEN